MKKLIIVLVFLGLNCFLGCAFSPFPRLIEAPYKIYDNVRGKEFVIVQDMNVWQKKEQATPSKKEPKYIIMPKDKSNEICEKIVDILPKYTKLKFISEYSYGTSFSGSGFVCAEVLTGQHKDMIVEPYVFTPMDYNNSNYTKQFNSSYALEATPENIAKIEKEIADENNKKKYEVAMSSDTAK
jgi:hypothetical protein